MEKKIEINIPMRTISEANNSYQNRYVIKKRREKQQLEIRSYCKNLNNVVNLPCTIVLTRQAPRTLDEFDNLPMAFKFIADAIADCIKPGLAKGQADRKGITFKAKQVKSKEYGVKIEIFYD